MLFAAEFRPSLAKRFWQPRNGDGAALTFGVFVWGFGGQSGWASNAWDVFLF